MRRVQTPRGHFHSFLLRPAVGSLRFQYSAPWSERHYELVYDAAGNILSKKLPGSGNEGVHYYYDDGGNLEQIVCGDFDAELSYDDADGTLESVSVRKGHSFDMRQRFKYHGGLLKETKVRFAGGVPALDNAVFRYQYDGNGRPSSMMAVISSGSSQDGKEQQTQTNWPTAYAPNTGRVEMLGNLRVSRVSANKTLLEDINSKYRKTVDLDPNGRVRRVVFGLRRKDMLTMELEYDTQNRLSKKKTVNQDGKVSEEMYEYTADGHISRVAGVNNYEFR